MKPVKTPYLYEKGELYRSVATTYTLLGFLVLPYIPGTTVEIAPLSMLLALGDHKQDAPVRATINFYNFISLSHNRVVWLRNIDLNCLDRVSPK